ncbi:Vacuolar protein-sorting-associated protein 27 [Apophysomyces ossiformis]|uniref:Vacuolar protein sorting-associated protein 27 n=1 Tax=Apophysomyces ossiformis TaxID=679940 RepID=A0A8H7EQQ6_9FUNG|nr:Vacuolar protein-sorting-associated protein 27 [Apophysomyces ossiformis]
MVSLWWSQTVLNEQIEKATSELLPAGQEDLSLHLEISDQIRSKKVNAKDAMRALKKRLLHKNPNVQLLAISLVDTCVKNGGNAFVREISSQEFMDEIVSLIRSPTSNRDVKNKALLVIQTWGIAAKGKYEIDRMTEVYDLLKMEGQPFPDIKESINPIFLETSAAPEWTDSDVCERCRVPFTLTNRKHHCRQCGGTFCQLCSSKNLPLPHLAINEAVRVCDGCYTKLNTEKAKASKTQLSSPADSSNITSDTSRMTGEDEEYDDDMKKVIELSLREAEQTKRASRDTPQGTDDGDLIAANADLAAAIAASLREMEIATPPPTSGYESKHTIDENDVSPVEKEKIELFSTLMERAYVGGTDIRNDLHIQSLHKQVDSLQSKLVTNLDKTIRKHLALVEIHRKLDSAVRTFDRILEERIAGAHNRTQQGNQFGNSLLNQMSMPLATDVCQSVYPSVPRGNHNNANSLAYPDLHTEAFVGTAPPIEQLHHGNHSAKPVGRPDFGLSQAYALPDIQPYISTSQAQSAGFQSHSLPAAHQSHPSRTDVAPLIDL